MRLSTILSMTYNLLHQFQFPIVASVQSITLSLVKADNEALLPVSWNFPFRMIAVARLQIMVAPVSPASLIISTTTPDGPAALPNFILEMAFFTLSMVIGICGPSSGGHWCFRENLMFRIPLKFHIEKTFIVFKPHLLLCVFTQRHLSCIISNWLVAHDANISSPHLVGKAKNF